MCILEIPFGKENERILLFRIILSYTDRWSIFLRLKTGIKKYFIHSNMIFFSTWITWPLTPRLRPCLLMPCPMSGSFAPSPIVHIAIVAIVRVGGIGILSYRWPRPHLPVSRFSTGAIIADTSVWGSAEDLAAGFSKDLTVVRLASHRTFLEARFSTRLGTLKWYKQ